VRARVLAAAILCLCLLSGCALRGGAAVDPSVSVVQSTAQILRVVAALQITVTTYAQVTGGRTDATDRIMLTIKDRVLPAADRVELLARQYSTIRDAAYKADKADDLGEALRALQDAIRGVSGVGIPDPLVAALVDAGVQLTQLIRAVETSIRPPPARVVTIGGRA
jgi:hypothetical protein